MTKRALAAILWFFAGWYAGALIALLLGMSPYFGPVLGTVAAALIAGDPFHLIWVRRQPPRSEDAQAVATAREAVQTTPSKTTI